MKKRIVKFLLAFLMFTIMTVNVDADSRNDKSTKTPINIQGKTFYAGVQVRLNYNQEDQRTAFIGDINANYDSDKNMIIASVKRSKINEVFEENDTSMYFNIELSIDYHDFTNDEFIIRGLSNVGTYWYEADGSRVRADRNYLQFLSTAIEIWGGNYVTTATEDYYLYKGNYYLDTTHLISGNRSLSDFADCTMEVFLSKVNWNFTIEEDVKADFKNIQEVVQNNGTEEAFGIEPKENLKIENVYTIYDNRNRNATYVQMFDEEGNPIILENDLKIEVDSSDNIDNFVKYFEDDDLNKIQILSFTYSKFFTGDANIKVYVGDKFETGDALTLYYYNPADSSMEKIEEIVYVDSDKYVSFQLHHFSDYVLVKNDNILKTTINNELFKPQPYIMIAVVGIIIITMLIIFMIVKKRNKAVDNENSNSKE